LEISTNGDYLNKERLVQLGENLTERDGVHITLHFTKQDKDYEKRKEELRKIVQGLDVIHTEYNETNLKTSTWLNFGQKCKIEYRVINFWASTPTQMITDRGETLNELKTIKARTLPCFTTVSQMQIEYDGSLQPCCNIHSSVKSHDKFSLGKLDANSNYSIDTIYELYKFVGEDGILRIPNDQLELFRFYKGYNNKPWTDFANLHNIGKSRQKELEQYKQSKGNQ
jgi:hypothetical protein